MGDISELRTLLVVTTFIGIIVLLFSMMSAESPELFAINGTRGVENPAYWDAQSSMYFVNGSSITMADNGTWTIAGYRYDLDAGGHLFYCWDRDTSFQLAHRELWLGFIDLGDSHFMTFTTDTGSDLGTAITPDNMDYDFINGKLRYTATCSHLSIFLIFSFDTGTYASPSDAWTANELTVSTALSYDQVNTGTNAFSLISQFLFFQMPDVHPIINAVFAIPLWIAIIYVSFILILRAIGAVFGGGGA